MARRGIPDEAEAPVFPPLLRGERAAGDPFAAAVARARAGADPGLVVWSRPSARSGTSGRGAMLGAAMVLAPEDPLERALGVFLAAPLALGNALAALAPPELAVQFRWPGDVLVNGARAARCRAAAGQAEPGAVPGAEPGAEPGAVPAWLVIGIEVALALPDGQEGGERPDETCLAAEGCGDVAPAALVEGWSRHMLVWINRWTDDGMAPLLAAWRARAVGPDGAATKDGAAAKDGAFAGIDETGALLTTGPGGTTRRPLSGVLAP